MQLKKGISKHVLWTKESYCLFAYSFVVVGVDVAAFIPLQMLVHFTMKLNNRLKTCFFKLKPWWIVLFND